MTGRIVANKGKTEVGEKERGSSPVQIRIARSADAPDVLTIYAPYVTETTVTFEDEIPTGRDFCGRISRILEKYPYVVAEVDGQIVGYAYASEYKGRAAYDWSVEVTVYLAQGNEGRGIGRLLYEVLEQCLRLQGVVNLTACITAENSGSVAFHEHCGFERVGTFPHIGYKFGRWLDVVWMQKTLVQAPEHTAMQETERTAALVAGRTAVAAPQAPAHATLPSLPAPREFEPFPLLVSSGKASAVLDGVR